MNITFRVCLGVWLACGTAQAAVSQETARAPKTTLHIIESERVGDTFRIGVALPEGYDTSEQSYPVIYVLDGDKSFGLVAGVVDWLSWAREIPPHLVVGISYGEGTAEWWRARSRDLTPTLDSIGPYGRWPDSGGADAFRQFLSSELIPFIVDRYRTAPTRTVIGLSFGGLFGAYDLVQEAPLFERYLLVSPALAWDDEMIAAAEASGSAAGRPIRARVYAALGTADDPNVLGPSRRFFGQLEGRRGEEFAFVYEEMPGETHISVLPGAVTRGLKWLNARD